MKMIEISLQKKVIPWFKWRYNSCWYDAFSFVYAAIISPKIKEWNITPDNYNIEFLNNLLSKCGELSIKEYNNGIWEFIKKIKI